MICLALLANQILLGDPYAIFNDGPDGCASDLRIHACNSTCGEPAAMQISDPRSVGAGKFGAPMVVSERVFGSALALHVSHIIALRSEK